MSSHAGRSKHSAGAPSAGGALQGGGVVCGGAAPHARACVVVGRQATWPGVRAGRHCGPSRHNVEGEDWT